MKEREHWGSRLGFIFSVAGSAVGLANIWRFPYIVGHHGGAAFIVVYLICLFLIGFPVFVAEIIIGRSTQTSPKGAFRKLGGSSFWGYAGALTIVTGFVVSSFYSAIAGWILGYLVEALRGNLSQFTSSAEVTSHYVFLMGNPYWGVGFHLLFLLLCSSILYFGVRRGIERGSKWMMPLLFVVLLVLVVRGCTLPGAGAGLHFLLHPDWSVLTPAAIVVALGQAFFTLSLGQGTIVTYGSYLSPRENIVRSGLWVVAMDTLVSLFSAVAVFTIAFSAGVEPGSGPGLLFQTLPLVFSKVAGGYLFAILFFLLVVLAALTSEISAMEPLIAYLIDEKKWSRHGAALACGACAFVVGIPSALSYNLLGGVSLFGLSFLDAISLLTSSILIPLGGFLAIVLVGWVWGTSRALTHLDEGASHFLERYPVFRFYFRLCFRYVAPILMIIVFARALGDFL